MGTISLGSNIAVLQASRRLNAATSEYSRSAERLASGLRINKASDDSAGLAVSSSLNLDSRVYTQAIRNGNDTLSALAIAGDTLGGLGNVLSRLRELATQSANGTLGRTQRVALNREAENLTNEFNRTVAATKFNGLTLLDGRLGRFTSQLGYGGSGTIGFNLGEKLSRNIGTGYGNGLVSSSIGYTELDDMALADFNGDGKLDLVTTDGYGANLALGNGSGRFTDQGHVGSGNSKVFAADVNGDGSMDLISSFNSASVFVGLGNGDGTFQPETAYAGPANIFGITSGDTNGDGITDIVVYGGTSAKVFLGSTTGTLTSSATVTTSSSISGLVLGDLNGDGNLDLITANGNGSIDRALGGGNGGFGAVATTSSGVASLYGIAGGDFNGDGVFDVVANGFATSNIVLLLGNGAGAFQNPTTISTMSNASRIQVADTDGDGISDILVSKAGSGVQLLKGRGDATFDPIKYPGVANLGILVAGDVNGDGVLDFVTTDGLTDTTTYVATTTTTNSIQRLNLSTRLDALGALGTIDASFQRLQDELGVMGAQQSRVQSALNVLFGLRDNSEAAGARIRDVDVASESAQQTRLNILQQTSAAVLAQASQAPEIVLQLLKF